MNRYKLTALVDGVQVEYIDKHPDLCKQALDRDHNNGRGRKHISDIEILDLTPNRKSWLN